MRLYWKYVVVSLLIGLLLGGTAGLLLSRVSARSLGWNRRRPEMMLRHFSRELRLTEAQREHARAVFAANREKFRACKEDVRRTTRAEMRKVLDPEQQRLLDDLDARFEARRRRSREDR